MLHDWGVPLVVAVLIAALWALIIFVAAIQKQRLLEGSQKELAQLNSAVAQHAASLFRDADATLRVIDRWLQANPGIDPRTDARFVALIEDLRRTSKHMIDPRLVSADGKLFHIPAPDPGAAADVRDSEYYKTARAGARRELHIGNPDMYRATPGIPIAWRLESPVSGIEVTVASIELARLTRLHEATRIKPDGGIVLIRADGIVLSRTPYDPALVGKNMRDTPGFRNEYGVKPRGFFLSDGVATDGVPRMVSYERLEDYPVVVAVSRGVEDVLTVFNLRRALAFALAGALTLLALVLTWEIHRSQRALRLAQHKLEHLEATDSLTGTMSRRAFLEAAAREFSRAQRYARPAAVLMLDIDRFKQVNDTIGHARGDRVLRDCTAAWAAVLREQDLLGRIGGEEFCAVLPETPPEAAKQAAERLREAIARLEFRSASGRFPVTVSIGVAHVLPDDADIGKTMERADQALYRAKANGRDRIESAEEAPVDAV